MFAARVEEELQAALPLDGQPLKAKLNALVVLTKEFMRRLVSQRPEGEKGGDLSAKKSSLEKELTELHAEEERVAKSLEALRKKIENE
jgi:hypothetical protein